MRCRIRIKSDEQSLLLESDRDLVKISTIHGSKGLEFPVVICPTLWEGKEFKDDFVRYHKDNSGDLTLNIDRLDSEQREEAIRAGQIESLAEEARKVYVALTRAKYECRVIWITHDKCHLSGLGAVLLGRDKLLTGLSIKKLKDDTAIDESMFVSPIEGLSGEFPKFIGIEKFIPPEKSKMSRKRTATRDDLKRRYYEGRPDIRVRRKIESFSSLAGHHADTSQPDYDQITDRYADLLKSSVPAEKSFDIFDFPKGPVAGTAIHKIFEHRDFRFDQALSANHSEIINDTLDEYGIDREWAPVVQEMVRNVSGADFGDLDLGKITPDDEIREMEFNFPVTNVKASDLYRIIRNESIKEMFANNLNSFLTGFIDLVVRQNGKYYLLDYKSNYLGDELSDYSQDVLGREIISAGYDLQYHLYAVALKKYLERKIQGFSYNKHIGGAYYCFVRGMQKESDHSIYFQKPSEETHSGTGSLLGGKMKLLNDRPEWFLHGQSEGWLSLKEIELVRFLESEFGDLNECELLVSVFLSLFEENGHVILPLYKTPDEWALILGLNDSASVQLLKEIPVVKETDFIGSELVGNPEEKKPFILDQKNKLRFISIRRFRVYEKSIQSLIREKSRKENKIDDSEKVKSLLDELFGESKEIDWQKTAAALSLFKSFLILSGGPGTGKTTTVARIIALHQKINNGSIKIGLAAPTGKAAGRMGEALQGELAHIDLTEDELRTIPGDAKTIHRLLQKTKERGLLPASEKKKLHYDFTGR